jgi:alkylation response protein AidB-like acyl-CoA dehydrogenase
MIQQAARDFAQSELLPGNERDEFSKFPTEQVKKMAELGFMGMMVDPKYGGSGLDSVSYVLAITEISKIDASTAVIMSVNNSLVCGIRKYANEEQKMKYLVPLAKGEVMVLLPVRRGQFRCYFSKTTAIDKGDYLLNGTKNWITNGSSASTYIVIAQTDIEKGHKGINAFIVEKGWPGFDIGVKKKKMGIRGSDTHSLMFSDVKVPKENRIGEDGFGFNFAMGVLNGGRIGIASQALGIATGAYELALKYSQERKALEKKFQTPSYFI